PVGSVGHQEPCANVSQPRWITVCRQPLGLEGGQGHFDLIEGGCAGDEQVVAGAAAQRIRAEAADQEVAGIAAAQVVVPVAAQDNGGTAAAPDVVVAHAAVQPGGKLDSGCDVDDVSTVVAVHDQPTRRPEHAFLDSVQANDDVVPPRAASE